ncbi:DUF397 domain-containing protein [Streptomyces griseochromogenes]|uniref:DUF397 domain-containing protein n=1 Tax=Streptomyces griseochromogenes TaxID=68214 RepID=UPI0037B77878
MSTAELHWFKSSYSSSSEPDSCVEVATTPTTIHLRDSKTPDTAQLKITPSAWTEFLTYAAK